MAEFTAIETQEQLDKIVGERLKREREKAEKEIAELKAGLEKSAEKDAEIEALQKKIAGYEKTEMKRQIALENKIPYSLAERINGDTEEEMIADAKTLSKYFEQKETPPPLKNPEIKQGVSGAYKELLDGLNLKN